jgi:Peptidase family M1 domain
MRVAARLILLFLCLTNAVFAAPALDELLDQHAAIRLGDAKWVTDFPVTVGHMRIVLEAGTATPVLAGEAQVGLFLNGKGTFTYESANADEITSLRYNAKNLDQPLKESVIREPFKSVLLRGTGLPEVTGAAATLPAEEFKELRKQFAKQILANPAAYLLALQTLNAPNAKVMRADITGTTRPYVYLYDDVWTHDESLALLRRPEMRGYNDSNWLYTSLLSSQAIGRANRVAAPSHVTLTHLDVALTNTDKDNAKLTVVETLVPQGRPLSAVVFDLYSDYIFDIQKEPRHFHVREVVDEAGNKLPFDHSQGTLIVGLAQPAPAGKPVKLRFEIDGDFLYRPDGSQFWQLGIEPWFPSLDIHNHFFTYHSVIKVKKPFNVFTSGKTIRREAEGEWNVLETKLDQPVDAIAILAGKYQFDEETKNGVTVRVASFVAKNAQAYKTLRGIAYAAIEAYPSFLGPFPFDEITIIEKNDYGYGQAPAGIIFITKEAFTPKQSFANIFVEGVNRRFAHEIAHMYWGHAVKIRSNEDQWIEEAFSEYSSALFMKMAGRKDDYDKALAVWKAEAKDASRVTTIPMANRLVNPGDWISASAARQGLIYAKGAYLLAALHNELGDQTFLTFLKSYQKTFRWKHGTTDDVIALLTFITKKDYAPWFDQHFYGTAMPELAKK